MSGTSQTGNCRAKINEMINIPGNTTYLSCHLTKEPWTMEQWSQTVCHSSKVGCRGKKQW